MTNATCPECGTTLAQATIDLEERPDVVETLDQPRTEFDAQTMAAVGFCENPRCPRHGQSPSAEDAGAVL